MKKESFISPRRMFLNNAVLLRHLTMLIVLAATASIQAQQLTSRPERGLSGKGTQQTSNIDSINLQNGAVSLAIPLASLPPVAGGKLSYTLSAHYNSKLYDVQRFEAEGESSPPSNCQPKYTTEAVNRFFSKGGWNFGSEYSVIFRYAQEDFSYIPPQQNCNSIDYYYTQGAFFKPILVTPDGTEHEMRIDGNYDTYSTSPYATREHLRNYYKQTGTGDIVTSPMRLYTVDGLFLTVIVNPSSYAVKWTIYMPDGTRIEKSADGVRTIDTNGNSILKGYNSTGGYAFARDEQSGREIRWSNGTYNNQSALKIEYQTIGGAWQTVWAVWGTTTVQGKTYTKTIWNISNDPPTAASNSTCLIDTPLDEEGDTFAVLREIVFPATEQNAPPQRYSFAYNSDTTVQTTDNEYYNYCNVPGTYTRTASFGLGEISQVTTPTGSVINYKYLHDGVHSFKDVFPKSSADKMLRNVITEKSVAHDGTTDTMTYNLDSSTYASGGSVTNPDGSTYSEAFHPVGFTGAGNEGMGGLQIRSTQSGKIMTEKHWTLLGGALNAFGSNSQKVTYNPVVDTEYTTLLADDGATRLKMTARKFQYDYNGNLTQTTEYDWFDPSAVTFTGNSQPTYGIPAGVPASATILRVINNGFYNQAADASSTNAYQKRGLGTGTTVLLGFLKDTNIGDGAVVKSKSQISYDGLSYGSSPNKGNSTQTSAWDDTNNQWINSSSTYDGYGNVVTTTDPKGSVTQIFYEDNTHAMPTKTIIDPQNGTGQQIATATYDFYTGAALTSTDINGNTSSISYYNHLLGAVDPYARPGTAFSPYISIDGVNKRRTVKTYYEDAARKTRTESDLFNEGDALIKTRESRDQTGITVLAEKNENGANAYTISSETIYKTQQRVVLQSNPHRASVSSTDGWTRATSDILGRNTEVETFAGASQPPLTGTNANSTGKVLTAYDRNTTMVTDQAGKQRRSIVDALGRLTRVDEPNDQNQLDISGNPAQSTNYTYDVLGNLLTVSQGVQTRGFIYDSLSRLKSASNPESGLISYQYDKNGNLTKKTDARSVETNYVYDALNRVTQRSYANEPGGQATTPSVNYTYENTTVTLRKGILTKVTNGFSITEYQAFDILGRVTQSQQTTDGTAYGTPMTYTYNLSGALIEEKYPSGRVVKNVLDNDGDLSIVQSKKNANSGYWNYADSFTYNAAGAVTSMQLGNGRWESTAFNSRLQPTQIALGTVQNGTDKLKLGFEYGTVNGGNGQIINGTNNGDIGKQTITVPTEVRNNQTYNGFSATQYYAYDSLNRLQSAAENLTPTGQATYQTWRQTFQYDRYGNRTFDTNGTNTTTIPAGCAVAVCNPQIDPATNKLVGYQYDASGNTKVDANSRKFTYDGENKQIKVETVNSSGTPINTIGEYFYDGDGKRVKKIAGSEVTIFIYDAAGKLVAEYANQISATPQVSYLTSDHLGSPRINTDANGAVTARHDYQPFGEEIQRASYGSDGVKQKFTSYERDNETELDFAQARMFGSGFGRFTSPDPILSSATLGEPQSWNRYSYVLNNPLVFTDPTGMFIWTKSLGGDVEDDDLAQHYTDEANKITDEKKRKKALKKIDKKVKNIIKQRNQIRAGIEAAKGLLNSDKLSSSQKSEISRSIEVYGEEYDDNNVIVGQQANSNGATYFGEDGRIIVTLGQGNTTQEIAVQFIHEGSHAADYVAFNNGVAGSDISLFATETRAWTVSAYAAQGLGLKSYPSSLPKNLRVWKAGWSEVDIATGVANRLAGQGYGLTPQKQGDNLSVIKTKNIEFIKMVNPKPEWNLY